MNNVKKIIFLSAMTLSTSIYLIGCNNSSQSKTQTTVQNQNQVLPSQSTVGRELFLSQSQDYTGSLNLALTIYGESNQIQNILNQQQLASPLITYNGLAVAQGNLTVTLGSTGVCGLPSGTYQLTSLNQGTWANAFVSNLRLQASGPASMVLSFSRAQLGAKAQYQNSLLWSELPHQGRLFGDLLIESVNGVNCQKAILMQ